jgi:hypothetical protein
MAGMFDDLVPAAPAAPKGSGLFDDLLPGAHHNKEDRVDHNLSVGGRWGTEIGLSALTAPLTLPVDILHGAANAGIWAGNKLAGAKEGQGLPYIPGGFMPLTSRVARAGGEIADDLGLDHEETSKGRVIGAAVKGAGEAITGSLEAKLLAKFGPKLGAEMAARYAGMDATAHAPGLQAIGGAAGGTVAQEVVEGGGDPRLAAAAALAAGVAAPAAASGVRAAARTGKAMIEPLTAAGQDRIAGSIFNDGATDAAAARAKLAGGGDSPYGVPGVKHLSGATSQDAGIASLENSIRHLDGNSGNQIGSRIQQNDAAREAYFRDGTPGVGMSGAGNEADLARLKATRDAQGDLERTQAFDPGNVSGPVDRTPIIKEIDAALNDAQGGGRAGARKVLLGLRDRVLNAGGDTPDWFYAIRQDVKDAMYGKHADVNIPAGTKLARIIGDKILGTLDNQVEAVAPGYKLYLDNYKQTSGMIDGHGVMQKVGNEGRVSNSVNPLYPPGATQFSNNHGFSPPALKRAVQNNLADIQKKLTPAQQGTLSNVLRDLLHANYNNAPGVRAGGSETFKNMTVSHVIGQVFGSGKVGQSSFARVISKPWEKIVGNVSHAEVADRLVKMALDPKFAAKLMEQASKAKVDSVMARLWQDLKTSGYAGVRAGGSVKP